MRVIDTFPVLILSRVAFAQSPAGSMTFWRNSDCTGDRVPITLDQASHCINIDESGSTYNGVSDLENYLGDHACTFFIPPDQPGNDVCGLQRGIDVQNGNNTACYALHRPTFRVGAVAECLGA